jgi:hypothetical protein
LAAKKGHDEAILIAHLRPCFEGGAKDEVQGSPQGAQHVHDRAELTMAPSLYYEAHQLDEDADDPVHSGLGVVVALGYLDFHLLYPFFTSVSLTFS